MRLNDPHAHALACGDVGKQLIRLEAFAAFDAHVVIPGRATQVGFSRLGRPRAPISGKPEISGASPEPIITVREYGFRRLR